MVFDGILISFVVGLLRRGNLRKLSELRLKSGWIFPLLLLSQLIIFAFQSRVGWVADFSNYFFVVIYVIGMVFLWLNRSEVGFKTILAGVALNFIVMAVNGGRMPVSPDAASVLGPEFEHLLKGGIYAKHQILTDSTRLGFLGDIIPLSNPYPRKQVISIGDVVMNIGIFLFIQQLMLSGKESNIKTASIKEA